MGRESSLVGRHPSSPDRPQRNGRACRIDSFATPTWPLRVGHLPIDGAPDVEHTDRDPNASKRPRRTLPRFQIAGRA
jgi:hypothetical protein